MLHNAADSLCTAEADAKHAFSAFMALAQAPPQPLSVSTPIEPPTKQVEPLVGPMAGPPTSMLDTVVKSAAKVERQPTNPNRFAEAWATRHERPTPTTKREADDPRERRYYKQHEFEQKRMRVLHMFS